MFHALNYYSKNIELIIAALKLYFSAQDYACS